MAQARSVGGISQAARGCTAQALISGPGPRGAAKLARSPGWVNRTSNKRTDFRADSFRKLLIPPPADSELMAEPGALALGVLPGRDDEALGRGLDIARAREMGAELAHPDRLHDRQRRI